MKYTHEVLAFAAGFRGYGCDVNAKIDASAFCRK